MILASIDNFQNGRILIHKLSQSEWIYDSDNDCWAYPNSLGDF